MKLTDWRGTEYGLGSIVAYSENYGDRGSRMLEGRVVDVSDKGTVILECARASRGRPPSGRRACRVPANVTVLVP